jgi:SAM-dependent methyltransferase
MDEDALFQVWKREEGEHFSGWDFSHLTDRCVEDRPPWSYQDMARKLLSSSRAAVDLGTGGGEILMAMKDVFPRRMVATEEYPPNIALARERLEPLGVEVVATEGSSLRQKLPFADGEFDLVIDRHTCYNIAEVARVLMPGGTFLTEQVDGRSGSDLCQSFGCVPQWPFFTLDFVLDGISSAGLATDVAQEWEGKMTFEDVGAIVYYLKAIPWIVPGFSVETHGKYLLRLQEKIDKGGKLAFCHRLLLVEAKKVQ